MHLTFVYQIVIYANVHVAFLLDRRLGSSATPGREIYEVFNYRVFRKLEVILHREIRVIAVVFKLSEVLLLLFCRRVFKLLGSLLIASCNNSDFKFV